MKRALVVATVAAALLAVPAATALPPTIPSGSVVGEGIPLKAYASVTPLVHLFGDALTAQVAVIADTKWVDPARIRVRAKFTPYRLLRPVTVVRGGSGRFVEVTWRWDLRCLTPNCVPREPPSDTAHVFHFRPARVEYLKLDGTPSYGLDAGFPPIEELSQLSPGSVRYVLAHRQLLWRYHLTPLVRASYRVSPSTLFWLALVAAIAFALVALAVGGRWALSFRPARTAAGGSTLDRALALFFWARERGDDTLQRKALERVAAEVDVGDHALSEETRALAWSPDEPEDEVVQQISARAHGEQEDRA